jgi:hypothetical protein
MEEWKSITKITFIYTNMEAWNYGTGDYTVTCTDGILSKSGDVLTTFTSTAG